MLSLENKLNFAINVRSYARIETNLRKETDKENDLRQNAS